MVDVRAALWQALESLGLEVADDTVASRGSVYVKAAGDLAAGVFEFKHSVQGAIDSMYQGHWSEGMPPRFAVLPAAAAEDPSYELLEQMHIAPLLYEVTDDEITFPQLDDIAERLRR